MNIPEKWFFEGTKESEKPVYKIDQLLKAIKNQNKIIELW